MTLPPAQKVVGPLAVIVVAGLVGIGALAMRGESPHAGSAATATA